MLEKWLKESNYTVILTGAGMSTESGLPDFRSANNGLWNGKDPGKIASTEALNENVNEFIEFYRHRVIGLKECTPIKGTIFLQIGKREILLRALSPRMWMDFMDWREVKKYQSSMGICRNSIARNVKKSSRARGICMDNSNAVAGCAPSFSSFVWGNAS